MLIGSRFESCRFLLGHEDVEVIRDVGGRDLPETNTPGRLSPITEGDEEDQSGSGDALSDYLAHDDPAMQEALSAI